MAQEDILLKQIEHGDMDALDALVRLYYPDILRYCLWHTGSRQNAEDATQDTFTKAIQHLDSYVHRGKFRAFLYKVAANVCTDQWRKREAEALPETLPITEKGFEETDAALSFQAIVHALPPAQREIVILRFVHGMKLREVAEILDTPLRTVQTRLRTALKTLEKHLRKEETPYV